MVTVSSTNEVEDKGPRELAETNMLLADAYQKAGSRVVELEEGYDAWFSQNRQDYNSDAATKRAWGTTEGGRELRRIKMDMKTTEKKMQTMRDYLRVRDNEKFNHY